MLELSKKFKLEPSQLVERLLIQNFNAMRDDTICKKKLFNRSIVYQLELPFSFPYECEEFDFQLEGFKARVYLERVPKRYVIGRLPFRTIATVIIELTSKEEKFAKANKPHVTNDKLNKKYSILAFNILKKLIIAYRRIANDYYNIGVVEPPLNFEEFQRKVKMSIILDQEEYSSSLFMPIKEDSFISVAQPLEENLRSKILASVIKEFTSKEHYFLDHPNEYFDAAKVFYYHEQWDLCLLQCVIAMESAIANLVFNSPATKYYLDRIGGSLHELKKIYRKTQGLPEKIEKFLFPTLKELGLNQAQSNLRKIMPFIHSKKREDGIYDLRSKIVHEGVSIGKKEAKLAIRIASQFMRILKMLNDRIASPKPKRHNPQPYL
ncbi:MAG: hypothetical protein QW791_08295 [Candidatus Bathyarchaeia archaeon]